MGIFTQTVQPDLLTLLSSSSEPALSPLFQIHSDSDVASAFVAVVQDTHCRDELKANLEARIISSSTAKTSAHGRDLVSHIVPIRSSKGCIAGSVIHLQDPSWKRNFIQAGSGKGKEKEYLGIELPWLGLHVRPLGKRAWGFDVGIIDARGVEGTIRISSLVDEAAVDLDREPPMLHLPLELPMGETVLTPWLHLNLHLPTMLSLFQTIKSADKLPTSKRQKTIPQPAPSAKFASTTFVRVYANCRVRRIWFSRDGEKTLRALDSNAVDELGLYAAEMQSE